MAAPRQRRRPGFTHGLAEFIASAQNRSPSSPVALAENRFRLVYQPVVHLGTKAVHHYEALLRPVFTPGGTIQNTQDFVTFAEAVGLSEELDWAVMQQAVAASAPHQNVPLPSTYPACPCRARTSAERATDAAGRTRASPGGC